MPDSYEPEVPLAETVIIKSSVPSTPLPDRYDLMGELGHGGMGVVYKVRDRETGEVLALKFLKPEIADDAQILDRFKSELRLAHKITHRNIARLYEFHRTGDTVFVSMEYVEGESLRELLKRSGRLNVEQGLKIARQLTAGLAEAHRQSIVHRDLKPENIMLTPSGEVKVMDFGISKSYAAGATVTGAIIGTPAYMAPEQAEGKSTDHRTDIYALGLVLYEMFTGSAPFTGETPVAVALKQLRDAPTVPSALAPDLPKHVERAILKCLEKDPAKRFQSVDDLLLALEGVPTVQRPRAPARSKRSWFIGGAAVVSVIIAGLSLWAWLNRSSDSVQLSVEQFTLPNGLPVVLSVDHSSPTFSLAVAYKAGVYTAPSTRQGLPILVTHLMSQGSPNVAQGEYQSLVKGAGGRESYRITGDYSLFSSTLPSNQLDLALFLEADRMTGLDITPEGMEAARALVQQQLTRAQSGMYGSAVIRFRDLAWDNPVNRFGAFSDNPESINAATVREAADFYHTYYTPSNAVLALVGDFDPKAARDRIVHYFGSIPAHGAPPAPDRSEPVRTAEKREMVTDPTARVPVVLVTWRAPSRLDPDWIALKTVWNLLGGNDAARLQTSLVKGAAVASEIDGQLGDTAGLNYFEFDFLGTVGKDPLQIESFLNQEIDRIQREGASEDELRRLRNSELRARALSLVSTEQRASLFAATQSKFGRPDIVNRREDEERTVTSEDLRRVAKKYLIPANRTILFVKPAAEGAP